ncbi:imidazolonepropionase [Desulfosarcina variabilis]|uniref:imidazolonepropionase n=1 Tax=Desulfosarcina variabilis TaxID=2300 RepID=UPI003AFB51DC
MNPVHFDSPIDALWIDCHLATMTGEKPYGTIEDGAMAVADGRIVWIGPRRDLPPVAESSARRVYALNGAWVTPGLIDCHTHLIYAGNRALEFEMRLGGATYEEIAQAGGGIVSTVNEVRKATEESLFDQSVRRLAAMQAQGVTTVEIKSGYGLDTQNELKMLRVARRLGAETAVRVCPTFLGAHALPPEYRDRSDDYVALVVEDMLTAVVAENLAEAVDVFCERIAFSRDQTRRIFEAATGAGLRVKIHAEQLSDTNGAALAAGYQALSADHLEYLSADGIHAMAAAQMVAVLLPGAFYFLKETRLPPVAGLRKAGVPMALATDCNPGTSPTTSPLLMMNLACILFGLTPAEALAGFTVHAARALGRDQHIGCLATGKMADFAVWDIQRPAELAYYIGGSPLTMTVKAGVPIKGPIR